MVYDDYGDFFFSPKNKIVPCIQKVFIPLDEMIFCSLYLQILYLLGPFKNHNQEKLIFTYGSLGIILG